MAVALALAVAASSVVALAFWSAAGAGSASAASGTLDAATITAPGSGINSVTVTWATQASLTPSADNGAVTYSVQRRLGAGSWAAVASGGCSGAKPRGTTSCVDAPAAAGSYGYRVVASYRTWTATSNEPAAVSFVLDSVAPTVQSIALLDAGTTNAATVHWMVTFSEAVSGVDAGDFALARSGGVTGGSISSVSGSATSYTVTSSTGSGDGTLGLNLVDDDTITDAGANKLGGSGTGNGNLTGAAYSLDRTAPTVTSIARVDSTPTNAATVHWTVTFSEPVAGVDSGDFALASTGPTGAAISSVSGSTTTYTVTSSTGSGDGTLGLDLVDDDTITDAGANKLGGTGAGNGNLTGATYGLDRTAPALSSLVMLDTNANGKVDRVTATFSETLASSTSTAPWTLAAIPSSGTLASVSTSGTVATLTVAEGAGAADTALGSFTIALAVNASGIRDATGNQASFTTTAPTDAAAPARLSMSMLDSNTNGKIDRLTATFSEPLVGSTPAVGQWTLASTPSNATLASVSASGSTATLALTEGTGTADTAVGSFTVTLATNSSGIRDATGNQSSFAATAPTDAAAPVRTALQMLDANANGKVDQATAMFSEALANSTSTAPWTLAAIPSSGTLASMSTSGAVATLTITEGASASDTAPGSFTIALAANASGIRDATGNQASFITTAPTDAAPPARVSMSMLDSSGVSGKVDHVTATFSEPLAGSTPTAGQWTLASAPSNGTLASVSTNGTTIATLTLTEGTGPANTAVGSFTLTLAADSTGIRDAAGNQSSFTATAPTDAAAPVKTALQMLDANHNGKVDQATATFSETLASSTNTLPWTPAAIPSSGTLASVSTSGAVATLTITEGAGARDTALGSFTIALAANASGIHDATGNQASFTTTAPTDAAGPVPITVSDNDTDTSFLNLTNGKLQSGDAFTATFSEPIASGLPASTPITESTVLVGNARLTITGFTNGALDMGSSDYVLLGISVVYAGTSALSNANKTITITAGTCTLLCINLLQGSGTSMVFVPAPTLLDLAGNGATGSAATGFTIF